MWSIEDHPALPHNWGVELADVMNSAKDSLDHLVYALARKAGSEPAKARTAFPISRRKESYFESNSKGPSYRDKCLKGVEDKWKERVDAIQPFHRRQTAHKRRLAIVADIANTSKHKMLRDARLAIVTPAHLTFSTSARPGVIVSFHPKRHDCIDVQTEMTGDLAITIRPRSSPSRTYRIARLGRPSSSAMTVAGTALERWFALWSTPPGGRQVVRRRVQAKRLTQHEIRYRRSLAHGAPLAAVGLGRQAAQYPTPGGSNGPLMARQAPGPR